MIWLRGIAAGAFEALALFAVLRGAGAAALGLHAAGCCCGAALLHRRLLEGRPRQSFALVFAGAFFVPVLGLLGLVAVGLATRGLGESSEPELVRTPIPEPPATAQPPIVPRPSGGRRARMEALAKVRGRTDAASVAMLRRALEDSEEEVRLLAHALLESKSRAAYRRIHETTCELEKTPTARRGALHRRLAFEHWEVAWLGLAQGECLEHTLREARRHADLALEADPASASLHFLLGRIDLRLGGADKAEAELARAAEQGMPAVLLRPYLAEAAFLRRRFDLVKQRLAQPALAVETVDRLQRYWT